jgi:sialate O-acetylesterase
MFLELTQGSKSTSASNNPKSPNKMKSEHTFEWPQGQQCAVSLTYDDALPVHHETVAPLLTAKHLTATFNVCANRGFTDNTNAWKQVAAQGHELGNHTLFHPCRREPESDYPWLAPHYDLCNYTAQRWEDEMRVANCLLQLIDGQTDRTFGNTCCHTTIGTGPKERDLSGLIVRMFVAARGPLNDKIISPDSLSYTELGHFNGDGKSFEELQDTIEQCARMHGWIILMFHGVGADTHSLFIDTEQHAKLITYLEENADRIWTASMVRVAKHLKAAGYDKPEN